MDSISHAIQLVCVYAIPLVLAITLHEAAHGWAASRLGDQTARRCGRLTLNPAAHIDPVGTIAVPGALLLLSGLFGGGGLLFGWAKPVPVNPWMFRNRRRDMMLTAVAGPAANALQMVLWALLLKAFVLAGIDERFLWSVCAAGISVNLMLMAFNLVPVPPLDGGRILQGLLPEKCGAFLDRVERYGMMILLLLMVGGGLNFLVRPFLAVGQWILDLVI